ncbi:Mitogen-activated protein kinase kinase kinase 1 [Spatholobus suberectus]|nr:Mitogen-activated protein kinase kinase kinase 1 [Spatholobus suberectus]
MDSEIEIIEMADIIIDGRSFTSAVDRAIRSTTASKSGESSVHSFASVVSSAIRSRTALNLGESRVHSFASVVSSAIRSRTVLNLGESGVHSFASVVDSAIRSRTALNLRGRKKKESVRKGELKRLKPRLERRNATKNIDYELKEEDADRAYLNQRSFRVNGMDGEFDRIFRSLGLSGPEDFAIPVAAWQEAQAQKARVASTPRRTVNLQLQKPREEGIKGVRPPVLVLPPVTSTWSSQQQTERDPLSDSVSRDDAEAQTEEASALVDESFHILIHNQNLSPNGNRSFREWQKGEMLGKGSFGTVYEGFTNDGNFFAVKEVSLLDDGSQGKQSIFQLQQEISLLSQFRHDNIVRYLGTDKDNDKLYIFLELVTKGSLASLYKKYRLRDSQVSAYTRQILSGLKYLHDRSVVHRDIKCANILVDANGSVKLADFGLAKVPLFRKINFLKSASYHSKFQMLNTCNYIVGSFSFAGNQIC